MSANKSQHGSILSTNEHALHFLPELDDRSEARENARYFDQFARLVPSANVIFVPGRILTQALLFRLTAGLLRARRLLPGGQSSVMQGDWVALWQIRTA